MFFLHMQNKSEGTLLERLEINWKFGNLISAIIEKSWPRDGQGWYEEDEEVVLQHLLSWTAAKNVFQLHGTLYLQCVQAVVTFFSHLLLKAAHHPFLAGSCAIFSPVTLS